MRVVTGSTACLRSVPAPDDAAGTLSDRSLEAAPDGVATAAHYGAGVGTGVLFLSGVVAVRWLTGASLALVLPVVAGGLFVLMNWFFSFVVVPVYGSVPPGRVAPRRRRVPGRSVVRLGPVVARELTFAGHSPS